MTKKTLVAFAGVFLVLFMAWPQGAKADRYDEQIQALNGEIAGYRNQISGLRQESNTLKNKLAILNSQIRQAEATIALNQARARQIEQDLAAAQAELERQRIILGENIKAIYQQGQVSLIEVLVSSNNLSEFVDKQEYLERLRGQIEASVNQINALKAELAKEQQALRQALIVEEEQRKVLASQRAEQASLLAQTQGQEANYQKLVKQNEQQIAQLRAQQAAEIAARTRIINTGGSGGYPWANAEPFPTSQADNWGFYLRQCTSYAAWKRYATGRTIPVRGDQGYRADARDWPTIASRNGHRVDRIPEVGAVAIYMGGPYGHAMIVEKIEGARVYVSQYNAAFDGRYSESYWTIVDLVFIH